MQGHKVELAIFDVFGDWFQREDLEACTFIYVLLEMGPDLPEEFARSWHILMKGSIISASEGDIRASRRARQIARWPIEHHRGL